MDQGWLCSPCSVPTLSCRRVAIARMSHQVNMGEGAQEVRFFILILCPADIKGTKTALETARTFASLLSDMSLRCAWGSQ